MSRVVFGKNAEPDKWFRLDSLLQEIAAHQTSDPSNASSGSAIDPQNSVSDVAGSARRHRNQTFSSPLPRQPLHRRGAVWPHVTKSLSSIRALLISRLATRLTLKSFQCRLRSLAEPAPFIRIQI